MSGMIFDTIGYTLRSLAGWVLGSIGWGGIVTAVAGTLLLLSTSARLMKFFASPRGMAATAAVMIAGIAFVWATWPQAGPQVERMVAQTTPRVEPTVTTSPARPKLAIKVAEAKEGPPQKPAAVEPRRKRQPFPTLPFVNIPFAAIMPPLPPVSSFTLRTPVIVPPHAPHHATHQAAVPPRHAAPVPHSRAGMKTSNTATHRAAIVTAQPSGHAGPVAGAGGQQIPSPDAPTHHAIVAHQRAARQAHARQAQAEAMFQMGVMMEQFHAGQMGGHPMHPMHAGGEMDHHAAHPTDHSHPGTHPAASPHPAGGMGHTGGHR